MSLERWAHLAYALVTVTLARGTVVFLLALPVTALARRLPSEARHLIWRGVILSFVLIPLAWSLLPALKIGPRIQLELAAANRLLAAPALARSDYLHFVAGHRSTPR